MSADSTTPNEATTPDEDAVPVNTAQPDAEELIQHLEKRLGLDGLKSLVSQCLKESNRMRAIQVINAAVGTVRLPASTDRGRMGRLIMEGLGKRRESVLDAIQTLTRDPSQGERESWRNRNILVFIARAPRL